MTDQLTAYSYLRFSTPDQMKGDSLRRQMDAAQSYADSHGLKLDTKLSFRDLGVSAFRGANVIEGALGKFIEAVDEGKVAKGSYLLVENLDRLSRDKITKALNRFQELLEKGIKIVTLTPVPREYDAESLNDITGLLVPLVEMNRAHEESKLKSQRLSAAWKRKRERAIQEGHKLTAKAPSWLMFRDGRFEVREDHVAIVRRIFELALQGHGKAGIAYRLNEEGVKPFGDGPSEARKADGWYPSYVQKVLRNPAVIGHYQPMKQSYDPKTGKKRREPDGPPIEDYFPAVIDEATYYRVKGSKPGVSGRKGKPLVNVLSGIVFCDRCGGNLHYVNKGKPPKGRTYLACDNARRKKTCDAKSVRYEYVWAAVIESMQKEHWAKIFGSSSSERKHSLSIRIEEVLGQISELETNVQNLLDILQRIPSPATEERLGQHETELARLKDEKKGLQIKLAAAPDEADWAAAIEIMKRVREMHARESAGSLTDAEEAWLGDLNVQWNAALKKMIERVSVGLHNWGHHLEVKVRYQGADEEIVLFTDPKKPHWPIREKEYLEEIWGDASPDRK